MNFGTLYACFWSLKFSSLLWSQIFFWVILKRKRQKHISFLYFYFSFVFGFFIVFEELWTFFDWFCLVSRKSFHWMYALLVVELAYWSCKETHLLIIWAFIRSCIIIIVCITLVCIVSIFSLFVRFWVCGSCF